MSQTRSFIWRWILAAVLVSLVTNTATLLYCRNKQSEPKTNKANLADSGTILQDVPCDIGCPSVTLDAAKGAEYLAQFSAAQVAEAERAVKSHVPRFEFQPALANRPLTDPDDVLCVGDSSTSHLELMLNSLIGVTLAGCKRILLLCYDEETEIFFKKAGFHTVSNYTLMAEGQNIVDSRPDCPKFLFGPMWARTQLYLDLIMAGMPFLTFDADTFHLRSFRGEFLTHDLVGLYGNWWEPLNEKPPDDYVSSGYFAPFTGDYANSIVQYGSRANPATQAFAYQLYWQYQLPNVCEMGFGQTKLNELLYNVGGIRGEYTSDDRCVWTGIASKAPPEWRDLSLWASAQMLQPEHDVPFSDTLIVHALNGGDEPGVPLRGRYAYLKRHGCWALRDDWRDVPVVDDPRQYLESITRPDFSPPIYIMKRPAHWMNFTHRFAPRNEDGTIIM